MKRIILYLSVCMSTVLTVSGCSLKYAVNDPPAPGFSYQNADKRSIVMKVVDQRTSVDYMVGVSGLQGVALSLENVKDPVEWLSKGVVKELNARGVPLQLVDKDSTASADLTLTIKKYQLVNHRASGFSAWESYNIFLGQLATGTNSCPIASFFFNSKIPVWSMDEIQKPCVSDPMGVVVKDVASKINRCVFKYSASDADVQLLAATVARAVTADSKAACFPLTDLGGTNNPAAMATLNKFAEHDDSFVHNCAVNAIGMLGAQDQFEFLEKSYNRFTDNDRVMPLKAIGDIGNSQAQGFLSQVQKSTLYTEENGVRYCTDLYLIK